MEVCVDSLQSVVAAYEGGANRIELCSSLNEGGLTPSYGLLQSIRKHFEKQNQTGLPVNCMVRCRAGDFSYSDFEIETMTEDLKKFVELEVDGLVFGALTTDGYVDTSIMKEFISLIPSQTKKTFHRAFDVGSDWKLNFESIEELGFDYLLTSGCARTAYEGRLTIGQLIDMRDSMKSKLRIIAGAGVNASNLAEILKETKCDEFHASCRSAYKSNMKFRNAQVCMGSPLLDEFETKHTDKILVKQLADIYSSFKSNRNS